MSSALQAPAMNPQDHWMAEAIAFAAGDTEATPRAEPGTPEELRTARRNLAAATAHLPVTMEMAWTVPQLLKRVQLVAPGTLSTSAVLRCLIRRPELDEPFARAFVESGFLSCDEVIARARWKYELAAMLARHEEGRDVEVLEQCRTVLRLHRIKQPLDWDAVLAELQALRAWFPELRTLQLLEQLYARLRALHLKSVRIAQRWLAHHAG